MNKSKWFSVITLLRRRKKSEKKDGQRKKLGRTTRVKEEEKQCTHVPDHHGHPLMYSCYSGQSLNHATLFLSIFFKCLHPKK